MPVPVLVLRTLFGRGLGIWVLSKLMAMVVLAWAEMPVSPASLALWPMALCAPLLAIDLHRRKERLLFHNLGISTAAVLTVATVPAVLAELVILWLVQ